MGLTRVYDLVLMADEPDRGENLKQVPLKVPRADAERVWRYRKRYSQKIGKGGAARVLLLMGLKEADKRGGLDLSVLEAGDERLEPDIEQHRNRRAATTKGKSKAARD